MDEEQWLACNDPAAMLRWLRKQGTLDERRARLFAAACCQMMTDLPDDESQKAIETLDRFADVAPRPKELFVACLEMEKLYRSAGPDPTYVAISLACDSPPIDVEAVARAVIRQVAAHSEPVPASVESEMLTQVALLRCIFRSPFRPLTLNLSLLSDTVVKLAAAIYEERAFERMPVLADALEDSGVTDSALLGHLRGPGPHARGCFALDLILGKS